MNHSLSLCMSCLQDRLAVSALKHRVHLYTAHNDRTNVTNSEKYITTGDGVQQCRWRGWVQQ